MVKLLQEKRGFLVVVTNLIDLWISAGLREPALILFLVLTALYFLGHNSYNILGG